MNMIFNGEMVNIVSNMDLNRKVQGDPYLNASESKLIET